MTIQFKKFIIGLVALVLGYVILIIFGAIVNNSRGNSFGTEAPIYLMISIGSIFIFYFLLKKLLLK